MCLRLTYHEGMLCKNRLISNLTSTISINSYIPRITASLRDPCEVVRRQTFILLSRLLQVCSSQGLQSLEVFFYHYYQSLDYMILIQRDYVKWRGVLFLRFLLSLVDESEKIRHLADFLFGSILKGEALLSSSSYLTEME